MANGPSLIRAAHGTAAAGGALLVVETPVLDELRPLDAGATELGLALRKTHGRPMEPGNKAASGRGASLTYIGTVELLEPDDLKSKEERRRIRRRAASLQRQRKCELEVEHGGSVSSAVKVELVEWARATAWADAYDRAGDAMKAVSLGEKASGHALKSIAIAERESAGRESKKDPARAQAELQARILGPIDSPDDEDDDETDEPAAIEPPPKDGER